MSQFLHEHNPIDKGIIKNATEQVVELVKSGIKSREDHSVLKTQAFHIVQMAGRSSLDLLTQDLERTPKRLNRLLHRRGAI